MGLRATEEGVTRGMVIVGKFASFKKKLVTVTHVRGAHSVDVVWFEDGVLAEANFSTNGIRTSEDFKLVEYMPGATWPGALKVVPWPKKEE